jgi:hypothetical protein
MLNCCLRSDKSFPRVSKKHVRPCWSSDVKPYKDDCVFWHKIWVEAGSPKYGALYDVKKHTKRQYMYANRRNKRRVDQLRKEKMAEAIANNNSRDFFKEFKRYEQNGASASIIDGKNKPEEIAKIFSLKYKELYNSVPYDDGNMNAVYEYAAKANHCNDKDRVVTFDEVCNSLKWLKSNKGDGDRNFMSNHLLFSCDKFLHQLAQLFTAILTHGYQPQDLLLGTIESIPKDSKGNVSNSSNYRGITLCNSVLKLYDIIVINRYQDMLITSDMQYAFKQEHSKSCHVHINFK